ncbi:hypothetical protein OXX69_008763 [Metschnikowia pulcherrima]
MNRFSSIGSATHVSRPVMAPPTTYIAASEIRSRIITRIPHSTSNNLTHIYTMAISPEFLHSDMPSGVQSFLLVLLALFVPPLPIYLLTGPNHTFKTKEFLICCVLTIFFFVIGVFYSVIFVLSIFPSARIEAGRDGYLRVGDIETQTGQHEEVSHQSGDIQQPEIPEVPHGKKYNDEDVVNHERPETSELLPPSYEETEGNSTGDVRHDTTKFGDNKVQH